MPGTVPPMPDLEVGLLLPGTSAPGMKSRTVPVRVMLPAKAAVAPRVSRLAAKSFFMVRRIGFDGFLLPAIVGRRAPQGITASRGRNRGRRAAARLPVIAACRSVAARVDQEFSPVAPGIDGNGLRRQRLGQRHGLRGSGWRRWFSSAATRSRSACAVAAPILQEREQQTSRRRPRPCRRCGARSRSATGRACRTGRPVCAPVDP